MRDIELLSTLLFSQDDLVDIRSTEGVIDPEGVLQVLGLAVGSGIAYTICRTMDQPFLQLVRDPSIPAWITGAVLTVLFTAVVNYVALRPVKNLKLTDVA